MADHQMKSKFEEFGDPINTSGIDCPIKTLAYLNRISLSMNKIMKRSSFHIDNILIEKLTKNRKKPDELASSNINFKFIKDNEQSQKMEAGEKYFINQNALNSLINMTRSQIQNMNESFRCGLGKFLRKC